MADAAAASHEHHADIGDVDHRHAVMPCPARQLEHAIALAGNGLRDLALQPRRAGHGAVLVGDVDLQRELAALGDVLDPSDDVGDRELAVRIGRRADIDGERYLPRDDIGRAGHRMDVADGADQPVFVGPAELLDRDDAFGGAGERVAPQRHRHGAGVAGHAGQAGRQPCRARDRGDDTDRQVLALPAPAPARCAVRHRPAIRCGPARRRRYDRDRDRIGQAHRASKCRRRPLRRARSRSKVPATARLPSSVEAKRTPSSSAKPVTSMANGNRRPRLCRSATQEIAVISPSGPSHLPASRTVS